MTKRRLKKLSKRVVRERAENIAGAIKAGYSTKVKISKATGYSMTIINGAFKKNIPLYQMYTFARKMVVDKASDNIEEIIDDPKHPNHYQASIYILKNYKSDLDEILETRDNESVVVGVEDGAEKTKVNITFK